jgi:hypothetical protein
VTVSIVLLGVLAGLIVALATIGAFALGLWFGERGRRKDAQRREGVIVLPEDAPKRAEVIPPGGRTTEDQLRELEPPERWIRETVEETGCSEEEARKEWFHLMNRAMGETGQGWIQG